MSETVWQRLRRGARRLCQQPDWTDFAGPNWADHIMTVAVTDRFHAKQGRSTGRWILRADGRRLAVYLKRHYSLPWWRGWLAALWPNRGWSPAVQEWRHLEWAGSRGLPVPRALAAAEYIGPWGRLRSFLAVEELPGMLPLSEALPAAARQLDGETFRRWKRGLVAEIARLARALHDQRRFHKDFYLCHFYIPESFIYDLPVWQSRVHLIDLHRLRHHPRTWRLWQMKDLAQLLYSSDVPGINVQDRLRFWYAYLGSERRSWLSRLLRYGILVKSQRYQRHNSRKKPIP